MKIIAHVLAVSSLVMVILGGLQGKESITTAVFAGVMVGCGIVYGLLEVADALSKYSHRE